MSNVTGRSWPTKRAPDGFASPTNAAVPTTQPWPKARDSAAGTAAMDILADAVFRIDAADHQRSGAPAKVVRNLGTGGPVLDCRTGSTSVPDTNDPLFLPVESSAYVYLPGVASNYLSVPSETALNITGDIEMQWYGTLDAWTSGTLQTLVGKATASTTNGYALGIGGGSGGVLAGYLRLLWGDGTNSLALNSTAAVTIAPGVAYWVKATLDVDDGSGNRIGKFYTSPDGSTWTQLGNTVTTAGTTSIATNTALATVNSYNSANNPAAGKVYRAIVKSGIDGTTVLDVDTSVLTTGSATSFTAVTGQTVTINRATSGRKTVVVPSSERKLVDAGNVYLPGVAGNYLSVPDAAAVSVTGDIDLRVRVAMNSWTPAAASMFIAKRGGGSSDISYVLWMNTDGKPYLSWSANGTTVVNKSATVATGATAGSTLWVRGTLDVDNGAAGNTVTFYTSNDGSTWTQLGDPVVTAGATSIFDSTSVVEVGTQYTGTNSPLAGNVYRAQVLNGIGGTKVLDIDTSIAPTNFTPGYASAFPAVTGQTVTLNSTAGSAMRVNGERWASGGPVWLFGTDDRMTALATGTGSRLLDIGPNDSFTAIAVFRKWGTNFNAAAEHIAGKRLSTGTGRRWILLGNNSASTMVFGITGDNTNASVTTSLGNVSGTLTTLAGTMSAPTSTTTAYVNGAASGTSSQVRLVGDITNPSVLFSIGMPADAATIPADMEIMSCAIWRRALSAAEIQTLTTYMQGRYA